MIYSPPSDSHIFPDFTFDLGDQIPQDFGSSPPPSPIEETENNDDQPSPLYQSQDYSQDISPPSSPPPDTTQDLVQVSKTIPKNEIDRILDHTRYNNTDRYKILFKNKDLPKRFFKEYLIPRRFIEEYHQSLKADLPYKKY